MSSDFEKPLIVDIGSSYCRFGFPGTEPSLSIPTVVGYPKGRAHMGMGGENGSKECFVGDRYIRAICQLNTPVVGSQVNSWDDMEVIFRHACKLLGTTPEQQPIIVTESLKAKHQDRIDLGKMLFEMKVPGVWVVPQGVTGLFATGRSTGVVLDSGEGRSHSVAVVNGVALPAAKVTSSICGSLISDYLSRLMLCRNVSHPDHFALVKEEHCYAAIDYESEVRQYDANPKNFHRDHQLPDGTMVSLAKERFEATELNFSIPRHGSAGSLEGMKQAFDLPTAMVLSATATEESLREVMLSNLVALGGNTLFDGFHQRLDAELNRRAALKEYWNKQPLKVNRVPGHVSSVDCNWIGASMLGSLSTAPRMYVTEEHMKEEGMNAMTKHKLAEFAR